MDKKTNKGKKYLTTITPKQQKFIDLYCSKYGELSATECAIRAGYEKNSAHSRASELLDWRQYPDVCKEIEDRQVGNRQVWFVDKEKHLANLTRIGNEARAKGQYGAAGKMEELKGKVQGFYVDRNLTITREVTTEDLNDKMRNIFKSKEDMEVFNKSLADELFEDDKKDD